MKRSLFMTQKVRFVEEGLQYDDGTIVSVTYEEILDACLAGELDTVSIFEIVSNGVQKLTGARVVKNNYRKSSLFNSLEREIVLTEKYIKKRAEVVSVSQEMREKARAAQAEEQRRKDTTYSRFSSKPFIYYIRRYK